MPVQKTQSLFLNPHCIASEEKDRLSFGVKDMKKLQNISHEYPLWI